MKRLAVAICTILKLSWMVDKRRLLAGASLFLGGSLAQPIAALLIRDVTNSVLSSAATLSLITLSSALAAALTAQLVMGHFAHLWYYELGELIELELTHRVARAVHGDRPLDQIESSDAADKLDLLRQDTSNIRSILESTLTLCSVVIQLIVAALIFLSVTPWLLLLLPIAVLPAFSLGAAERGLQHARERAAVSSRLVRHLRDVATDATSAQEVRLGAGLQRLRGFHRQAQQDLGKTLVAGQVRYALVCLLGQLPFAGSLLAVTVLGSVITLNGTIGAGDLIMVLALAGQVGGQVATALQQLGNVNSAATGLARLTELDTGTLGRSDISADLDAPATLSEGIRLEDVSYRYPGADRDSLTDVSLRLQAGMSLAVVGENGSGKSTFIKLIQGVYQPTTGNIFVNNTNLQSFIRRSWYAACSSLFQDSTRFEFRLREFVGFGHLEQLHDLQAVHLAIRRAKASAVVSAVGTLESFVGATYDKGRALSGGQWQKVGLARALFKEEPLVLALDEPGHSLDPESELAMIESYEHAARDYAARSGAVAIYVTHRLSSVQSADLVMVLRDGRLDALGTHNELLAQGGYYAKLFMKQAAAYSSLGNETSEASSSMGR